MNIRIVKNKECNYLNDEQLLDLHNFHWKLFSSMVPMAKNFLVFSKDSYLIAPAKLSNRSSLFSKICAIFPLLFFANYDIFQLFVLFFLITCLDDRGTVVLDWAAMKACMMETESESYPLECVITPIHRVATTVHEVKHQALSFSLS